MNKFLKRFSVISLVAYLISSVAGIAGELDGKRAICKFPAASGLRDIEIFLIFSQDKVTVLDIMAKAENNTEYGFSYTSVTMSREVKEVYVKPASIFWGNFIGESLISKVTSRDDIGMALLMGGSGVWRYIDRNSLVAENGIAMQGQAFTQSGKCEISDESGEAAFSKKYQDLKRDADEELRKKLEEAKSIAPKL